MAYTVNRVVLFILLYAFSLCASEVGESAVITLIFPFSARSTSMGEVGVALPDNQAVAFYNPAIMAIPNKAWKRGSLGIFYENLLPEFNIRDLYHSTLSLAYQPDNEMIGGFSFFFNHLGMGENQIVDAFGREGQTMQSYENVFALTYGFHFRECGLEHSNFGISAKYIYSALAPELDNGQGVGQTFAIDFGYIYNFNNGLKLGYSALNMGGNIFYMDRSNADPLPFTMNLALSFDRQIFFDSIMNIALATEIRVNREFVHSDSNGNPDPFYKAIFTDVKENSFKKNINECELHWGIEIGFMNTGYLRYGLLIDYTEVRYESNFGIGVSIFNHFNLDFGWIISPEAYMKGFLGNEYGSSGIRDHQARISFTYTSAIRPWNDDDLKWWRSIR